ncbi:MAG: hypothetical protein FVQ79_09775 [Planctomycetes bacterium]|nr:hypothetical protein [Planctomycetota bacterium]
MFFNTNYTPKQTPLQQQKSCDPVKKIFYKITFASGEFHHFSLLPLPLLPIFSLLSFCKKTRLLHTKNFSFAKKCKKMRAFAHFFKPAQNTAFFCSFLQNMHKTPLSAPILVGIAVFFCYTLSMEIQDAKVTDVPFIHSRIKFFGFFENSKITYAQSIRFSRESHPLG